ncbi:MAG: hypothetical protein HPY55_06900 [Firmicutes bacterium]|nr:hypothetical protein [Bacillota bacterium]
MSLRPPDPPGVQPYPGDALALARFERERRGFVELSGPDVVSVVLGRTTPLADVLLEACAEDGVTVFRRKGGGGAVVLAPGMIVITVCFPIGSLPDVEVLMRELSGVVVRALEPLAPGTCSAAAAPLGVRGFGDVCVGDRKILGSSLYLRREVGLFQASLLVMDCAGVVRRYLAHPSREPAYRAGRAHGEFMTSLEEQGYATDVKLLERQIALAYGVWLTSDLLQT